MTVKPSRLRAFGKSTAVFFVLITALFWFDSLVGQAPFRLAATLVAAGTGSILFGFFSGLAYTPREISWDEGKIRIEGIFPEAGEFTWQKLEAYSAFRWDYPMIRIKFEGRWPFRISSAGFTAADWDALRTMLQTRFPEKKRSAWFG